MDFDFNNVKKVEESTFFLESESLSKRLFFYGEADSYRINVRQKFRYDDGKDKDPTHLEFIEKDGLTYFRIDLKNEYTPIEDGPDWKYRGDGYGADYNVGNNYVLGEWTSWRKGLMNNRHGERWKQRFKLTLS
jgi:hypothetical protein